MGNFIKVEICYLKEKNRTKTSINIDFSFTIGFGHTNPYSSLTIIGRICSYILTVFGLLFNGLILQELIKGFLKIYRQE